MINQPVTLGKKIISHGSYPGHCVCYIIIPIRVICLSVRTKNYIETV
jgi:hypothetical protein